MAIEIERRFLVLDDSWRKDCIRQDRLRDGIIASSDGRKVRVRIYGHKATLTIKSRKIGCHRAEFEYEIPRDDAEQLLIEHCGDTVLVKTRHYVVYQGFTWEVDVYDPPLSGVVFAEIEIENEEVEPPLPPWVGQEVTAEATFRNLNLLRITRGFRASAAPTRTAQLGERLLDLHPSGAH
jgi:adenylate cyclase